MDDLSFKNSSFSGFLVKSSAVVCLSGMILTIELSIAWR